VAITGRSGPLDQRLLTHLYQLTINASSNRLLVTRAKLAEDLARPESSIADSLARLQELGFLDYQFRGRGATSRLVLPLAPWGVHIPGRDLLSQRGDQEVRTADVQAPIEEDFEEEAWGDVFVTRALGQRARIIAKALRSGPSTVSDLARNEGLVRMTTSRNLKRMEAAGLVERDETGRVWSLTGAHPADVIARLGTGGLVEHIRHRVRTRAQAALQWVRQRRDALVRVGPRRKAYAQAIKNLGFIRLPNPGGGWHWWNPVLELTWEQHQARERFGAAA
jgi:DNA-binding transcriptional ArsR family regulator